MGEGGLMYRVFYDWFLVRKMEVYVVSDAVRFTLGYEFYSRQMQCWDKEEEFLKQYAVNR